MRKIILIVLICMLILPLATAQGWIVEGDTVYVNDSQAYISASPHTLQGSEWVEFTVRTKSYSGKIDAAWGFSDDTKVSNPQIYQPHNVTVATSSKIFHNVSSFTDSSAACDYGVEYAANKKNVTYTEKTVDGNNNTVWQTTSAIACYDRTTNLGDNDYEAEWDIKQEREWKSWNAPQSVEWEYNGKSQWYVAKEQSVQAGKTYRVRAYVQVPMSLGENTGKYDFAVKPSSQTLQEAKDNGNFYLLDPWWNTSWGNRFKVTVNSSKVDENVTDFPVFINLSDAPADFWNKVNSDGSDVVLTQGEETEVPRELLSFDVASETGELWGRVNLTENADTILYVYYNNSAADKQNDPNTFSVYNQTQHLNEVSGTTAFDSSPGLNNGTYNGDLPTPFDAQIYNGSDFDGTGDFVDFTDANSADYPNSFSISMWYIPDDTTNNQVLVEKRESGESDLFVNYQIFNQESAGNLRTLIGNSTDFVIHSIPVSFISGSKTHIVSQWNGTHLISYINGSQSGGTTSFSGTAHTSGTDKLVFGIREATSTLELNGVLDEVRTTNTALTSGWISTEYNNQFSPSTFYTVGPAESVNEAPLITIDHPTNTTFFQNTIDFNFSVTDSDNSTINVTAFDNGVQVFSDPNFASGNSESIQLNKTGTGTFNVTVNATDNINNVTETVVYTIDDFELRAFNFETPVNETQPTEFFSIVQYNSDLVSNVTAGLIWNGTFRGNVDVQTDNGTHFTNNVTFTIPLVQTNNTAIDVLMNHSVFNLSTGNVTDTFNTSTQTQNVHFAYFIDDIFSDKSLYVEGETAFFDLDTTEFFSDATTTADIFFDNGTANTSKSGTESGSIPDFNYSANFNVGEAQTQNDSREFWGEYTVSFQSSTRTVNSTIKQIFVRNLTATDCSSGSASQTIFMNLTTLNEDNRTERIFTDMDLSFTLFPVDSTSSSVFSFKSLNKTNHTFCLFPTDAEVFVDTTENQQEIEYLGTDGTFAERKFFLLNESANTSTPLQKNLFTLNSSLTNFEVIGFDITNNEDDPFEGVVTKINRYYPEDDEEITVAMIRTGTRGKSETNLRTGQTTYAFEFFEDNVQIDSARRQIISENPMRFRLLGGSKPNFFEILAVTDVTCQTSETSVNCSYTTSFSEFESMNLTVKQHNPVNFTVVCDDSSTELSASLNCTGLNATENIYLISLQLFNEDGDAFDMLQDQNKWHGFESDDYGTTGLVGAFILISALALAGVAVSVEATIVLTTFGFIVSWWMGMISFGQQGGIEIAATVILIAAVLIWRMSRR